jgi:hypothetical protein
MFVTLPGIPTIVSDRQAIAVGKRKVADALHAARNKSVHQAGAAGKRRVADALQAVAIFRANPHAHQVGATGKRIRPDVRHAVRNHHAFQGGSIIVKRLESYVDDRKTGDRGWNDKIALTTGVASNCHPAGIDIVSECLGGNRHRQQTNQGQKAAEKFVLHVFFAGVYFIGFEQKFSQPPLWKSLICCNSRVTITERERCGQQRNRFINIHSKNKCPERFITERKIDASRTTKLALTRI